MEVLEDVRTTLQYLSDSYTTIAQAHASFNSLPSLSNDILLASQSVLQAHSTFTSHCNVLFTFVEQLQQKVFEISNREREVEDRSAKLKDRETQCALREYHINAKEMKISAKFLELDMQEKEYEELAILPPLIKLNVRGTKVSFTKKALHKFGGRSFENLIQTHFGQPNALGEIFVDRDPGYFICVLNCFLKGKLESLPASMFDSIQIQQEFSEYNIPAVPIPFPTDPENELLPSDSEFHAVLKSWLKYDSLKRIYKASIDGFGASAFHRLCDDQGPTLTLIKTTDNFLFGGFTPLDWESEHRPIWKRDPSMFLFTLINPHSIPPTQYFLNSTENGMTCQADSGPYFRGDLRIDNYSNRTTFNSTSFPQVYVDTTGKGNKTFTGSSNFVTSEIEVFVVL